jgi:glycerol kinase
MRAFIEAPCFRTSEVITAMEKDLNFHVHKMSVDGGMTVNNFMMQTQANFIDAEIERKVEKEITSAGAAIAAGLSVGFWNSLEDVKSHIKVEAVFSPAFTAEQRAQKINRFQSAVQRSIGFGWENEN